MIKWYEKIYGRKPRLFKPVMFSEKMQWRKLFDRSPRYTRLCDKDAVRSYVAEQGFGAMLIPTLWLGDDPTQIPFDTLPRPFILKSTHGSHQFVIVREDSEQSADAIVSQPRTWLSRCHGTRLTEPGYLGIPRRLIVEPLLRCQAGEPPIELKVFVFHGTVRFLEYVRPLSEQEQQISYLSVNLEDLGWEWKAKLGELPRSPPVVPRPTRSKVIEQCFKVAEAMAGDMDHCRVDFYVKDEDLFIGELTPYSWSGMHMFSPQAADVTMGSYWVLKRPAMKALVAVLTTRWGGTAGAPRPFCGAVYRAEFRVSGLPATIEAGETQKVEVAVKNAGRLAWEEAFGLVIRNAWAWPSGKFIGGRAGRMDGRVRLPAVAPGAEANVVLSLTAPMVRNKDVRLMIDISDEGHTWAETFGEQAFRTDILVTAVL